MAEPEGEAVLLLLLQLPGEGADAACAVGESEGASTFAGIEPKMSAARFPIMHWVSVPCRIHSACLSLTCSRV